MAKRGPVAARGSFLILKTLDALPIGAPFFFSAAPLQPSRHLPPAHGGMSGADYLEARQRARSALMRSSNLAVSRAIFAAVAVRRRFRRIRLSSSMSAGQVICHRMLQCARPPKSIRSAVWGMEHRHVVEGKGRGGGPSCSRLGWVISDLKLPNRIVSPSRLGGQPIGGLMSPRGIATARRRSTPSSSSAGHRAMCVSSADSSSTARKGQSGRGVTPCWVK